MMANWISVPALFSVHLGFAALYGAMIHRIRDRHDLRVHGITLIIGGLLLMAAIWVVPISSSVKLSIALFSTVAAAITAFRFEQISIHRDWAWLYIALSMGLILLWSISQGQAILAVSMSVAAGFASILAVWRAIKSFSG
jgi:hypothetical protein